jgi:putative transposase
MQNNSKNIEYSTNRHSCFYLKFHLVVVTKFRKPIFDNEELVKRLYEITGNIIETNWNCKIDSINTDSDHVHIMFSSTPQTCLSKLVNNFKTVTSRRLRKEFHDYLKQFYFGEDNSYFWSNSYFIGTVSEVSETIIKNYIENQGL